MKKLGLMNGHDEIFLAYNAILWKITNVIFFFIWGCCFDKYGFPALEFILARYFNHFVRVMLEG